MYDNVYIRYNNILYMNLHIYILICSTKYIHSIFHCIPFSLAASCLFPARSQTRGVSLGCQHGFVHEADCKHFNLSNASHSTPVGSYGWGQCMSYQCPCKGLGLKCITGAERHASRKQRNLQEGTLVVRCTCSLGNPSELPQSQLFAGATTNLIAFFASHSSMEQFWSLNSQPLLLYGNSFGPSCYPSTPVETCLWVPTFPIDFQGWTWRGWRT